VSIPGNRCLLASRSQFSGAFPAIVTPICKTDGGRWPVLCATRKGWSFFSGILFCVAQAGTRPDSGGPIFCLVFSSTNGHPEDRSDEGPLRRRKAIPSVCFFSVPFVPIPSRAHLR